MNREERKAWLERQASMTKEERDVEELKAIKARVYGLKKAPTQTQLYWLIMAEKGSNR